MPLFNLTKKSKNFLDALKKRESGELYSKEEFKSIIEKERARADRDNHKLSLVIFDMGSSDSKNNTTVKLIRKIKDRVRCIDETGWYDEQQIGMILPYTSNKGATKLAENICESLDESIPKPVCTVYTYPLDKLNN
jgi:PleD family two-component response regulator